MNSWLITQRLELNRYGEEVDVLEHAYLDFFVPRLGRLVPVPNHPGSAPRFEDHGGLVVTGGGDLPRALVAGAPVPGAEDLLITRKFDVQSALVREALAVGLPVIAICYGFQLANLVLGGTTLWDVHGGAPSRRPGLAHEVKGTFQASMTLARRSRVNSFHMQGIARAGLAPDLECLVEDADFDVVEAARHRTRPLLALQWHPEREGPRPNLGAALIDDYLAGLLH